MTIYILQCYTAKKKSETISMNTDETGSTVSHPPVIPHSTSRFRSCTRKHLPLSVLSASPAFCRLPSVPPSHDVTKSFISPSHFSVCQHIH